MGPAPFLYSVSEVKVGAPPSQRSHCLGFAYSPRLVCRFSTFLVLRPSSPSEGLTRGPHRFSGEASDGTLLSNKTEKGDCYTHGSWGEPQKKHDVEQRKPHTEESGAISKKFDLQGEISEQWRLRRSEINLNMVGGNFPE